MHKTLFAGDMVYDKKDHHDAVLYSAHGSERVGILEAIFVQYAEPGCQKLVIWRVLQVIDQELGNASVVKNLLHFVTVSVFRPPVTSILFYCQLLLCYNLYCS